MEYVDLSETTKVSRIVQGFWGLTDWNFSTDELVNFMNECIELGVTTFDTAEIYADTECESQMGLAFKQDPSLRDKIQLVSKTGIFNVETPSGTMGYYNTTYERVIRSCKESIERLNCNYIDLYLIHREDPCIDHYETARALKDLKNMGLIKEAGVSNFDPFKFDALNYAMDGELITNQIEVNPCCFEHFDSGMIDVLTKYKISPMIWSPLSGGEIFTNKEGIYTKARKKLAEIAKRHNAEIDTIIYAWILYHPMKAIPLSGSHKISRLKNAIKAFDVKLEHYEWYEIYIASGQQILK